MPRNISLYVLTLCTLGVWLWACTPLAAPTTAKKLQVVGTTTQVTALAKEVGGDKIELKGLMQANIDAHRFEPTPEDVRAVTNARVVIKNGLNLEGFLEQLIRNSGTRAIIVDASKGVPTRKGDEEFLGGDPHIWHSVPNAILMLNNIRDGLTQADSTNAGTYRANAAAYEKKLLALDQYIMQQIATLPPENRKLVSDHDTFGYYTERYGLVFVGSVIPSLNTTEQPSAQEVAGLIEKIKAEKVKAIFTEASVNPKLARQIAQDAGVRVVDGALYGDSLGPPGSGAETLEGMLKLNTDLIVASLK